MLRAEYAEFRFNGRSVIEVETIRQMLALYRELNVPLVVVEVIRTALFGVYLEIAPVLGHLVAISDVNTIGKEYKGNNRILVTLLDGI